MQVEGSGTRGYWFYKYDNFNRVIELKRDTHTITMTYNSDGTLAEIKDDNYDLQKQFYFVYRKRKEERKDFSIKTIKNIFEDYIKYNESTDSKVNKDSMTQSLENLNYVTDYKDLELLINVWMYYDPDRFS